MTTPDMPRPTRHIRTVLVANRGEIACRVLRTVRAMGLVGVAVYSDADADALHVAAADTAVRLGPAPAAASYLDIDAVLAAARSTGADAIHPGYGFLSENARFARACADAGIIFLGPPARAIETMGDKIAAKAAVSARGVPTVPGISRPGLTDADLIGAADDVGYPVLVKPSAGGGGKGMRRVERADDLPGALASARREAAGAFGDDTLFLERFVDTPRHIEVQVLADTHGNVVHLGERECSLQRRHQKVIEEAPSPLLDDASRARIGVAACDAARSVGYVGAGTVEFIVSAAHPDEFFFMEMNTRLQVEHPVTELVTGVDLVEAQIRIGAGEEIGFAQDDVTLTGHAVEARVYAEDPGSGFLPTGGDVLALTDPDGPGVRVDSGLRVGTRVGSDYDPMLAKVIAHGRDRSEALARLDTALAHTRVLGLRTNVDFCRWLLTRPDVVAGRLDTGLLERELDGYSSSAPPLAALAAVAEVVSGWATASMPQTRGRAASGPGEAAAPTARAGRPWSTRDGWRLGETAAVRTRLSPGPATTPGADGSRPDDGSPVTLAVRHERHPSAAEGSPGGALLTCTTTTVADVDHDDVPDSARHRLTAAVRPTALAGVSDVDVTLDGVRSTWTVAAAPSRPTGTADLKASPPTVWVGGREGVWDIRIHPLVDPVGTSAAAGGADLTAPMPGAVVAVHAADGARVEAGDPVVALEAMKMEHTLRAATAGTVAVHVHPGEQVRAGHVLATVTADAPPAVADEPPPTPGDRRGSAAARSI